MDECMELSSPTSTLERRGRRTKTPPTPTRIAAMTKHRFKGKLQEWTDCVDKCSIILYGFELTKANRLRKPTVDALMALYNEFCG